MFGGEHSTPRADGSFYIPALPCTGSRAWKTLRDGHAEPPAGSSWIRDFPKAAGFLLALPGCSMISEFLACSSQLYGPSDPRRTQQANLPPSAPLLSDPRRPSRRHTHNLKTLNEFTHAE